jgi:hypothetical protein
LFKVLSPPYRDLKGKGVWGRILQRNKGRSPPLLTIHYSIEVIQTILTKYNNNKILIKTCTEKK